MQNDREIGNAYEKKACLYLQKQGVRILKRNFRTRQGEIDIIGLQDGILIFFEVKYRKNTRKGYPQEAVGRRKQIQISRIAMFMIGVEVPTAASACSPTYFPTITESAAL